MSTAFLNSFVTPSGRRAQAICSGKTKIDAARIAGFRGAKRAAERLSRHPLVTAAIDRARAEIREATLYDAKSAMAELGQGLDFALRTDNATAFARIVELRARLHGLLIERSALSQRGSFILRISGINDTPAIEGEASACPPENADGSAFLLAPRD